MRKTPLSLVVAIANGRIPSAKRRTMPLFAGKPEPPMPSTPPTSTDGEATAICGAYDASPDTIADVYSPVGVWSTTSALLRPDASGRNSTSTLQLASGFSARFVQLCPTTAKSSGLLPPRRIDAIDVGRNDTFLTSSVRRSPMPLTTLECRSSPGGFACSVGSPPTPRNDDVTEIGSSPTSETVRLPANTIGSVALNTR